MKKATFLFISLLLLACLATTAWWMMSRPVVGLTRYALAGLLRDKGVPDELVHQTMDCLAQSDAARFAPAAAPNAGLLAETEQLITALDPFLS